VKFKVNIKIVIEIEIDNQYLLTKTWDIKIEHYRYQLMVETELILCLVEDFNQDCYLKD
jgi:hypothetical protein